MWVQKDPTVYHTIKYKCVIKPLTTKYWTDAGGETSARAITVVNVFLTMKKSKIPQENIDEAKVPFTRVQHEYSNRIYSLLSLLVSHVSWICKPGPKSLTVCVCCHLTVRESCNNQGLCKTEGH